MNLKYLSYVFLSIALIIILVICLFLLVARVSFSESQIFQGEVRYKVINIGDCGIIRETVEELIGNRCLSIDSGSFIVSKDDFEKIWPNDVSVSTMQERNYTIYVILSSKPSLFGEYGPAKIIKLLKLDKKPNIRK